jgi:hypothetical protein
VTTLSAHAATLAALTTAAGVLMARVGMRTGALRLRAQRRCVSCGTVVRARVCPRCGTPDRD